MLKAVIFDMDGVLIDSQPLHYISDQKTLARYGVDISTEELERYAGTTNQSRFQLFKERYDLKEDISDLIREREDLLIDMLYAGDTKAVTGIPEFLRDIRAHGLKTAVASSSSYRLIGAVLKKLCLEDLFDFVFSGETVAHGKPAPDVFLKTAGHLGVRPGECFVIEDSSNGVLAAWRAGMNCIGYINPTSGVQDLSRADLVTDDFRKVSADTMLRMKEENIVNLKGRNFLKLLDFSPEEILWLVDHADELKAKKKQGIITRNHEGKNVALIFEKTSTRTRCSFEVAAADLGMHSTFLDPVASQIGKKESIADTARVLGRIYDGIEYRGFDQSIVEEIARYAGVPVWNGLTNQFHPTQVLADIMTIREKFGHLKGIKLTYMGDARYNMGNSLMVVCAKMGMHFTACTNKAYFPDAEIVAQCREIAKETGASITLTEDVDEGARGADVIYTDVWVSMGEPDEIWEQRIKDLLPYQVNAAVMAKAGPDAVFMHCLPAFHDLNTGIGQEISRKYGLNEMEVTDEVFESAQSVVFDEAENRMHTIKAVMDATL